MKRRVARILEGATVSLIAVCALEGAASLALFAWDTAVRPRPSPAERKHTPSA